LVTNLYRAQKRKDHGFPDKENLRSGSKLNLFFPADSIKIAAGLSNEKVGTIEIPLLVTLTEPEK
jgi:hypothetical protein